MKPTSSCSFGLMLTMGLLLGGSLEAETSLPSGEGGTVKDKLCDGTKWHLRTNPANPAADPYFPIGQATLILQPEGNSISIGLQTLTPNFKQFETRIDGGKWKPSSDHSVWRPKPGRNRFEARTINQFGVVGPISTAEIELAK